MLVGDRAHAICIVQIHAAQTYKLDSVLRLLEVRFFWCIFRQLSEALVLNGSTTAVTHSRLAGRHLSAFKWQAPPKPSGYKAISAMCVNSCTCMCTGEWLLVKSIGGEYQWAAVGSTSVCLCPLGAVAGDNISCPLCRHLLPHLSWCHLSWPRTKLSPWETLARCAPCAESNQPCPAPTHAGSAFTLLTLITASLAGRCTRKKK